MRGMGGGGRVEARGASTLGGKNERERKTYYHLPMSISGEINKEEEEMIDEHAAVA